MKTRSFLLLGAVLLAFSCGHRLQDGEYTLTVLSTNDVHGTWFDSTYIGNNVRRSLFAINTYVDSVRTADGKDNVVLIDVGDCLQGDNAAYYYNYVDTLSPHLFPRLMDYMHYDAVVWGNHDVETGHAVYDRVNRELLAKDIPFLAGNAIRNDNGKTYFPLYKIVNRGGLRIAILGYNNANIKAGDVIVGLASFGQATYEKEYNGGMGSNGLTSARHDVFAKYLAEKYPESYDAAVPDELVYSGSLKLTDKVEGSPLDAGKLVLSPTRTYAPVVKRLLDELRPAIHGMVHCSGGAQTKVLHFVEGVHVVKDNLFPVPPLFRTIKEQSGTDWREMYKVFNMGHRLEVYLDKADAQKVIEISKSFGIDAQIIGRIEPSDHTWLTIKSEFGEFTY